MISNPYTRMLPVIAAMMSLAEDTYRVREPGKFCQPTDHKEKIRKPKRKKSGNHFVFVKE